MKIRQIVQVLAALGLGSWAVGGMAQTQTGMNAQQANEQGAGVQNVVEKVLMTHPEIHLNP